MKIKDLRAAIEGLDGEIDVNIVGRDGIAFPVLDNPQVMPVDKRGRYSLGAAPESTPTFILLQRS